MRATDAKILEELDMLYGDKDCFASIDGWLGAAEEYWTNLERLFIVADYAKQHNPSANNEITAYSKRIVEFFHQTKNYASLWNSKRKEKNFSTAGYKEINGTSWDTLDKWTKSQEELRQEILDFMELLYSVALKP
jgi:hypothetical protein